MSLGEVLTRFDGRIARGHFWPALMLLLVAFTATFFLVYWLAGGHWPQDDDPTLLAPRQTAIAFLAASLATLYPSLAVSLKRLHDLDRSGWWCAPVFALDLVYAVSLVTGWSSLPGETDAANPLGWSRDLLFLALLGLLGFLPGSKGANRYGPDPHTA